MQFDENFVPIIVKDHMDNKGGHPHAIMDNIDNCHVSVGFSTQKHKGRSKKSGTNYTLDKSPLNDGKHSYMRRQGTVAPKGKYANPRSGSMTEKDFTQAQIYAARAKQKYIDDKKGKKK
ncbi:MAG: hypothetical protein K2L51_05580 [Clostridiales bacterium]|nr:hypothetical protein [Clostridiales bacterium]